MEPGAQHPACEHGAGPGGDISAGPGVGLGVGHGDGRGG